MVWPFGLGAVRDSPPPLQSRLIRPAKAAVVLLGAGASAPLGAPLMRDFIDRGRDYLELNRFPSSDVPEIRRVIELHDEVRSRLQITELDLDNIENLLSISELPAIISTLEKSTPSLRRDAAASVKRFIELVLVKAISVPAPAAGEWVGLRPGAPHKAIAAALSLAKTNITVITLNYDCLLEYVCHCMGVPFTYHRDYASGAAEILKLHGSINWLKCNNGSCSRSSEAFISEMQFIPAAMDADKGTIELKTDRCPSCGGKLRPLIVPPTWAKPLHEPLLQKVWSRAYDVLAEAETILAVGYSLPLADAKIRELFHVGLMTGQLRQATVITGGDEQAAQRWSGLFRESWRDNRLAIRPEKFELFANGDDFFKGLSVFDVPHHYSWLPPLSKSQAAENDVLKLLSAALGESKSDIHPNSVDWCEVVRQVRNGKPSNHDSTTAYRSILARLGFDWMPPTTILPAHGSLFTRLRLQA